VKSKKPHPEELGAVFFDFDIKPEFKRQLQIKLCLGVFSKRLWISSQFQHFLFYPFESCSLEKT
jgi:hypothetical protein